MLSAPGSSDYYTFIIMVLFPDRLPRAPARYQGSTGRSSDLLGVTSQEVTQTGLSPILGYPQRSLCITKEELLQGILCIVETEEQVWLTAAVPPCCTNKHSRGFRVMKTLLSEGAIP